MKRVLLSLTSVVVSLIGLTRGSSADVRSNPLKDLNGYFPFQPPASLEEWKMRREEVRRRILVSQGLWPEPTKTPLRAVVHGKIDGGEYTVEKVFFESAPGFFVTGNLYRPKGVVGKVPGVLFAHGHWKDARLSENTPQKVREEIASGQERFEHGGKSRFQSLCVHLARMGCVVWQWDMLGDSDAIQLSRELVHGFAKQRPEMNTPANWGLYSPQAEAHLQSVMGLQTWNAVRGLDFLLTLPEVDPQRIAITGSSGGGTQTMILAAIDDRVALSFPVVMVSTSMQGGCTCENASLLRIGTGNVEFAALFAPKPQGMNTAADWTRELATKGFPDLQALYELHGKKQNVEITRGEHFPHNYNAVTRSAFYTLLNKHFKLGQPVPVIERDYEFLPRERLTVWDERHPAPRAADPEFERSLLRWFHEDSRSQLARAVAAEQSRNTVLRPAWEVALGRTWKTAGLVGWDLETGKDTNDIEEDNGFLSNQTYGEKIPIRVLYKMSLRLQRKSLWDGPMVIWLDGKGRAGLRAADGSINPAVKQLLEQGMTVIAADLFDQGADAPKQTRVVANPREFAGFTFGYNNAVYAHRVHDVLSILAFLRRAATPKSIAVAGWGDAGPVVAAARALAGNAVDRAVVSTGGFRFGSLLDYRDPLFLPGSAKYLDVPGLLALGAPHPTWVAGESGGVEMVDAAYRSVGAAGALEFFRGEESAAQNEAVRWLLR